MARRSLRDWLTGRTPVAEAAPAPVIEEPMSEAAVRLKMLPEVLAEVTDYVLKESSEGHTAEMQWRARQNWVDLTSKAGENATIDEETRVKNVKRSRLHYINDPLYVRAVNLTADFIFGKGIDEPREVKQEDKPEGEGTPEAQDDKPSREFAVIDRLWNDSMNLRVMSGSIAQIDRCRQLLIDGEVVWLVFPPKAGEIGTRFWPDDTLRYKQVVDHPNMPGVPLLYKRGGYDRTLGGVERTTWMWSTAAVQGDDSLEELKKLVGGIVSDREWAESKLDESFTTGPWCYAWAWGATPLASRGNPPFFSVLDWGESNVMLSSSLQTYVKAITAITYKRTGKMTANDITQLKTNIASTLSLTKPPPPTGTMAVLPEGHDLKAFDVPTGGAELFKTGFEISRLMFAAGTGLSTQYLGDPSTGNLATATAMELPQLKYFEGWQRWFTGQYDEMFRIAVRAELKVDWNVAQTIEIDFPELASRDVNAVLQSLATGVREGFISLEDAARMAAREFGEGDVEAFVARAKGEYDKMDKDLLDIGEVAESQPMRFIRACRRAARAVEAKQR